MNGSQIGASNTKTLIRYEKIGNWKMENGKWNWKMGNGGFEERWTQPPVSASGRLYSADFPTSAGAPVQSEVGGRRPSFGGSKADGKCARGRAPLSRGSRALHTTLPVCGGACKKFGPHSLQKSISPAPPSQLDHLSITHIHTHTQLLSSYILYVHIFDAWVDFCGGQCCAWKSSRKSDGLRRCVQTGLLLYEALSGQSVYFYIL